MAKRRDREKFSSSPGEEPRAPGGERRDRDESSPGEEDPILDGPLELDHDELLAESEYNIRTAGREAYPVTAGSNRRLGVQREEDISVDPEELGRYALEEATQDFHSRTANDDLPEAEWPALRWGERQMVESVPEDEPEEDRLLGHFDDRSEFEERISDRATRQLRRVGAKRRRRRRLE